MRFTTLSIAEARDLLTRMHPAARLRPDAVAAYAQAMREGSWVMNGVPVTLSREGRLLDGVQRLSASVEAGIPSLASWPRMSRTAPSTPSTNIATAASPPC
ncbi:hypothetical protein ACFQU7_09525 [Pseudoroseomonas wenyumeiae]